MTRAFVAFGANLGDPAETYARVADGIREFPYVRRVTASKLYRTVPVGGPPDQGLFLNGCLELEVADEMGPEALFADLAKTELRFGRVRGQRWDARPIDLDLLLFGDRRVETSSLLIPHPRMHYRAFVLAPLTELGPDVRHPILRMTMAELHALLSREHVSVLLCCANAAVFGNARQILGNARPGWKILEGPSSVGFVDCDQVGGRVVGLQMPTRRSLELGIESNQTWAILAGESESPGEFCTESANERTSTDVFPCFDARGLTAEEQIEAMGQFVDSITSTEIT
ncbi:MAG: 2-amino-4-hydroxy-6-hydroxymethyldihydropteridine diphosphokinase [Planctomycetota bacterium]